MKGLPEQDVATLFPKHQRPGLLILDDLMNNVKDSDDIVQLFTKGTHRCDVCAIYIAQNPFPGGKHQSMALLGSPHDFSRNIKNV